MNSDEKEAWKLLNAAKREQSMREGFQEMDPRLLARIPDSNLATLQADFPPSSPQFIRAEHEWQRRILKRQVRAAYVTCIIAAIFGLLGTLLGWWLAQRSEDRAYRQAPEQSKTTATQPAHPINP